MTRTQTRAERNIAWIERYCVIPEGKDVGKAVRLRPWQKKVIKRIYDNPDGTRRAIISVGRKNAKTTLSSFLLLLHICGPEGRVNSQLYSAAQSRDQASILFKLAAKAVRMSPDLLNVVQIRETVREIICPELGTVYKALSAEATTAYGLSPVFVVHDELGQVRGPRSEMYDALETAVGAQEAPLSIVISTQAPTDEDLLSVLIDDALEKNDPRTVLMLYSAPSDIDPFTKKAVKLANPAFGDFLNETEVMAMAADAKRMPASEARFRNLVLNQRVETNDPYIAPGIWVACGDAPMDFAGDVYAGLDLSASYDLTAFVRVGWNGDRMDCRSTFWLPEFDIVGKSQRDRVPYDVWARNGDLVKTPGKTVDYDYVAPVVLEMIRREKIAKIAFDRWNWKFFKPALQRAGASEGELARFVEFGQGFQSMSPALRSLDGVLLNGSLRHGGHPVLTMCARNSVVKQDPAGNRKLVKLAGNRRIDGMIALAMAVAVAGEPVGPPEATPWDLDPEFSLAV